MDTFAVQEKQMEVCEVCGAFLIVGDAQSRVDDHLMGKQHMGYAKIKTAITEMKVFYLKLFNNALKFYLVTFEIYINIWAGTLIIFYCNEKTIVLQCVYDII